MAYIDSNSRPSVAGVAMVVAIHAAAGFALLAGLTVSGIVKPRDKPMITMPIDPVPPPPPSPTTEPQPQPEMRNPAAPEPRVPAQTRVPMPLPLPLPTSSIAGEKGELPILPPRPTGTATVAALPVPTPAESFVPVAPTPRNDPAGWVRTQDYRSNWIRQDMAGKARFRLSIAADGRVTDCTITNSSGHPELDAATCALVTRRARFQPARGPDGGAIAGTYASAIDWRLPD